MAFQRILAMTEAEIREQSRLPSGYAFLGCHFSPEGLLAGLPGSLPAGCGLVIDDRNPIAQADRISVKSRLMAINPSYLILDFQRTPTETARGLAAELAGLPFPAAMPPEYARGLDCPLFLPPVPPHTTISEYLKPWQGREIWLELALDAVEITITADGSAVRSFPHAQPEENAHIDSMLHCHYKISQHDNGFGFYCYRTGPDIEAMLRAPLPPNLTRAVGLFRELGGADK